MTKKACRRLWCGLHAFSFYIHPTATLLLISVSHRSTSPPSARKSAVNHRIKVLQITEFLPQLFSWFMQYKDLIDAKVPYLSKLSPGGPIPHNHGEGFDAALDLLPQQPSGPIPQNMAKTFDGPPTLERSGSEHRVGRFPPSLLRREGRGERWSPL